VASGAPALFFPIDNAGNPALDVIATFDLSRVRAMSAVHYFGFPRSMVRVRRFCDERGISLIEDCAHAMFGRSDDGALGTWGDYAIGSLTKFFPVVDGGCLVSRERPISARSLRHRRVAEQVKAAANSIEIGATYRAMPGVDRVLGAMFAAANAVRGARRGAAAGNGAPDTRASGAARNGNGIDFTSRASVWSHWIAVAAGRARIVALRRRNYEHMAALFAGVPGTRELHPVLPEGVVPYVFPLWVEAPQEVYPCLRAAGIPLFRWDDVWPGMPELPNDVGRDWSIRVFQLACHQDLSLADLSAIADTIKQILRSVRS
jgi:dTDP-4-amino-4,6-dideoxygalactose transaminase